VTFQNDERWQLYARRADDSWEVETVDADVQAAWMTAIAIDHAGVVHVAYFDYAAGALWHARRKGDGSWERTLVDGDAHWTVAMAIGSDGVIHLAYFDAANDQLRYASSTDGRIWSTATVASAELGGEVAIVVDAAGTVHIVSDGPALLYARRPAGGVWDVVTLAGAGAGVTLAVDPDDRVHVAYVLYAGSELVHGYAQDGGWTMETVIADASVSEPALAISARGEVELAYGRYPDVLHARRDAQGTWSTDPVVSMPSARDLSFAIDGEGRRHFCVFDEFDGNLFYALAQACQD
jgi:hypothetical protein